MSRVLILLMFVIWLGWKGEYSAAPLGTAGSLFIFFGVYGLLVLLMGAWSRWLARRVTVPNFSRSLARLNRMLFAARAFIPIWFVVGIAELGWWQQVDGLLGVSGFDLTDSAIGVALGTLPAFLAWGGLWWAQYPAEIAFREQSVLAQLEADLPVHRPPTLRTYLLTNVRLQLLFMVVPVMLIVVLHDAVRLAAALTLGSRWELNSPDNPFTWLVSAALVFLFAPEILRRVLHTERLPNSPLRRRLEALCRRTGVRYRDILLWRTQHNLGNAAVMGFVPRLRYILLSDLLIETMTDEQIEAVFAHELGHIVHRHMAWLVVFMAVLMLFNLGGGAWVTHWLENAGVREGAIPAIIVGGAFIFKFLILFGFVSRRFERQADVFAARTMELSRRDVPDRTPSDLLPGMADITPAHAPAAAALAVVAPPPLDRRLPVRAGMRRTYESGHVGQYGAAVFRSALHRVAIVNNIPIDARSWCHGSIANRMRYLGELSADPLRTERFDRVMLFLYGALVFSLFAGGAFCVASLT